jgi:hypothetical protein
MDERVWTGVQPGDGMDDDRLLAYALGLDDDPELAAAAAADQDLGRRLDAVRADVDTVAAGVLAAVPDPGDDYTDLGDPRWAGLQEFFAPAQERPAKASRGARRWWRVLAPVAAVAVALAVGVAVIQHQQDQRQMKVGERSAATGGTAGTSGGGAPVPGVTGAAPVQGSATSLGAPGASDTLRHLAALHEQMNDFALIVLATARSASHGFQNFLVVRVFKGHSPHWLRLKLDGRLASFGSLHLLLLRPVTESKGVPSPGAASQSGGDWAAGASPEPSTSATEATAQLYGASVPIVYTYQGTMAVARALPTGTDPATVTLP